MNEQERCRNDRPEQEAPALPVSQVCLLVRNKLKELSAVSIREAQQTLQEVQEMAEALLAQDAVSATAADWHNLCVTIARSDLYELACRVLDRALRQYGKNTDLLADYLEYGRACGRLDRCEACFRTLDSLPRVRYGWRAFLFSFNWLRFRWENSDDEAEMKALEQRMLAVTEQFRSQLPDTEESYVCRADYFALLHRKQEEEQELRLALERLQLAPKSALKLADLLADRGDFAEACTLFRRGLRDSMQSQQYVNEAYLHYMEGVCRAAVLIRGEQPVTEADALEIYNDFEQSLGIDRRPPYLGTLISKTKYILSASGAAIPAHMPELRYAMR